MITLLTDLSEVNAMNTIGNGLSNIFVCIYAAFNRGLVAILNLH